MLPRLLLLVLLVSSTLAVVLPNSSPLQARESITVAGQKYVSLNTVAQWLGMNHVVTTPKKRITLRSEWTTMVFDIHARHVTLNGTKVYLGFPVTQWGNDLYISSRDYEKSLQPILTPHVFSNVPKLYHIVIDPGHGGRDPGGQNPALKLNEKDVALKVAQKLAKKLRSLGYKVTLTRNDDRFIDLSERPAIANRVKADLFISIHFNATSTPSVSGVETYIYPPQFHPPSRVASPRSQDKNFYPNNKYDTWSTLAGYYIHKSMAEKTRTVDRGLKRDRFRVLQLATCPAVLVEGGFVTNTAEGRKILSATYQDTVAQSIADGILTYQKTLNRLRGL